MRKYIWVVYSIIMIVFLAIVIVAFVGDIATGQKVELKNKCESILIGATEKELISALGEPGYIEYSQNGENKSIKVSNTHHLYRNALNLSGEKAYYYYPKYHVGVDGFCRIILRNNIVSEKYFFE